MSTAMTVTLSNEQSASDTGQLLTLPESSSSTSSDGTLVKSTAAADGQLFTRSGRLSRRPANLADYV